MKFNLKMFRNNLPKKSVLKKNKWVLFILALVILIGLYWYSKKSQENYYNSRGEGPWGGSKNLKRGIDGKDLPPVRVDTLSEEEQTNLLRFANQISGIRDAFYKIEKENSVEGGPSINGKYCFIERKKGTTSIGEGVQNLNDYGSFIDSTQIVLEPSSIWTLVNNGGDLGPERPATEPGCSDLYSTSFDTYQQEIINQLTIVENETLAGDPEPEYINEMIHEQVTLYLGHTECEASTNFLNKIWNDTSYTNANNEEVNGENLRQEIIKKFPGIELDITPRDNIQTDISKQSAFSQDIIRCEKTPTPGVAEGEDLSATANLGICKLAGFYADTPDKSLSFPLIQYSFLGRTNKDDTEDGYTRYTVNFDPTKKLDTTSKKMVDEDAEGGVPKTVYTSKKIIDWLSDLRGN